MPRHLVLLLPVLLLSSCSSSVTESTPGPDPEAAVSAIPGCYAVVLGGKPSEDVSLPTLIELSSEPATVFMDPGTRFAVKEPGVSTPKAPFSWWTSSAEGTLEVVLGGGYTGYTFSLRPTGQGSWAGEGTYCADFGVLPEPGPLPVQLTPRSCS